MYNYAEAYQKLLENKAFLDEHNFVIESRSIPEEGYMYQLDPRVKHQPANSIKGISLLKKDFVMELIRSFLSTSEQDITKHAVVMNRHDINEDIHVFSYVPLHENKILPCLLYIHGGSFIGGSAENVHEVCKALAEKTQSVVVNVEYRLAPEHPYPTSLMDCYEALCWCHDNPADLPYDVERIGVCGDSAGGGLSASLVLLQTMREENMISFMALLYPCVLMRESETYPWDGKAYVVKKDKKDIIESVLSLRAAMLLIEALYLKEKGKPEDPLVSPLYAPDMSVFPPTLIISAEFDYLRLQGELFAKKLREAGVDVRCIRYDGMQHAFMDRLGTYPQAERAIDDIAETMNRVLSKPIETK